MSRNGEEAAPDFVLHEVRLVSRQPDEDGMMFQLRLTNLDLTVR